MFTVVKHLHVWFALFSIIGFVLRVIWLSNKPELLNNRLVKILPHINDSALFACGVFMAVSLHYPLNAVYWFTIKLCLVLLYILLGFATLKLSRGQLDRFALLTASVITYSSIVVLAVSKPNF